MADPMGASTCVACGECVQACPTGALMEASALDAEGRGDSRDFDAEVRSVCPYCGVGCQVSYKLKDGRIAWVDGVDGPANEGRLCVKGRFGFDYVSHPHRLTRPLIRRDDAPPKGLNVDPANPFTHFREASWEEALDAAAGGLDRLRRAHGGAAVAGFGSAKCSNEEAYLFQKLIRQGFGHNNVDHCTRLCHASSVAALMENVGSGAVTATFNEIENADLAIVIGANPTENHPVAATYFKQFAKRGGELIVMDPRGMGLRRHATRMLQFRPGTDVALLNAIMNVIVEEELYDRQYIGGFTEGFDAFAEHIRGFPPEAMAALCGIDADTLRCRGAELRAGAGGDDLLGHGDQPAHPRHRQLALPHLAGAALRARGAAGDRAAPACAGRTTCRGRRTPGSSRCSCPTTRRSATPASASTTRQVWRGSEIDPEPGLTVTEILDAVHAGAIRGMYILGENPAMSDPDVEHAREALAKLEHLVVQDVFLTETANFADVILPASAWAEKTGTVTNTNRQVQMGRKALEPPGEAREDWRIVVDLGRRLGLDWDYAHPREVFAEMKLSMPSLDHITWERLEAENAVGYPSLADDDPGQAVVFGDGFPREGGRARFTPARVTPPARGARRRLSLRPDHRAAARALAHRLDDPAGVGPRRAGARGDLLAASRHPAPARGAAGRHGAADDAARQRGAEGARRPGGGRGHGLHPLRLRRGGGEHPDQPGARPLGQDPRVQVRRGAGGAGRAGGGGGVAGPAGGPAIVVACLPGGRAYGGRTGHVRSGYVRRVDECAPLGRQTVLRTPSYARRAAKRRKSVAEPRGTILRVVPGTPCRIFSSRLARGMP